MARRGTIAGGGTDRRGTSKASASMVKSKSDDSSDEANTVGSYPQLTRRRDANRVDEDANTGTVEPSSGDEEWEDHPGVSLPGSNTTKNEGDVSDVEKDASMVESETAYVGLRPPTVKAGVRVQGTLKEVLRKENKQRRIQKQLEQGKQSYWSSYKGKFLMPWDEKEELQVCRNDMCPRGLALHHPAASTLLKYATGGCPVNTGRDWTIEMTEAAIERGPHVSALVPEAIGQLAGEVQEKSKRDRQE
jgi:hypothetical protein